MAEITCVIYVRNPEPALHALSAAVDVRACGYGDDDPTEFWLRVEGNCLSHIECEPYRGDDRALLGTVYRWWHESLPEAIREGVLWEEEEPEGEVVSDAVFQAWRQNLISQAETLPTIP